MTARPIAGGDREQMMSAAVALEFKGREAEAIVAYEQLLDVWPGEPDGWYNLARLQRRAGQPTRALASYREALERRVSRAEEVHLNRGVIFSDDLNQYQAAEAELKKALEINPAYVPALINYANLHEDLGNRELAANMYERMLALDPDSPSALARYANLKDFSDPADPLIGRLRRALSYPGISAATLANVEFALGRALDSIGAHEAAFQVYRQANRHSREGAPEGSGTYDLAGAEAFTRRLIEVFAQPAMRSCAAPTPAPHPIFICGMFRSGSTLLEQLLAGHPRITAGGELDFIPRTVALELAPFPDSFASLNEAALSRLAQNYLARLRERFPEAIQVIDKRPDNYWYVGLIKALFPHAKIIHSVRAALDNCLSLYFLNLDQNLAYALDLMDIGHQYRLYLRLMQHWRRLYPQDILDVNYDSLVIDPKPQLTRVLNSLGLDWDDACAAIPPSGRAIKTASVWQVRGALHTRSSGRARHYQKQLSELQKYIESPL